MPSPNPLPTPEQPKRPRAKRLRKSQGPFATGLSLHERGKLREIQVTLHATAIEYRLKGLPETYFLHHATGFVKAVGIRAGIDTGPRDGRLKRGEQHL